MGVKPTSVPPLAVQDGVTCSKKKGQRDGGGGDRWSANLSCNPRAFFCDLFFSLKNKHGSRLPGELLLLEP